MSVYGRKAAEEDLHRVMTFSGAIKTAAKQYGVRACVVAGILSRETRGLPKFFIGDQGNGHGPMQIDKRFFPDICAQYRAGVLSNEQMILHGTRILKDKIMFLRPFFSVNRDRLERAGIAAYNAGEGRMKNIHLAGSDDFDSRTTGKNYSADVLERAAYFAEQGF